MYSSPTSKETYEEEVNADGPALPSPFAGNSANGSREMSGQPFDMIRANSSAYTPVPNSIPEGGEAHEMTRIHDFVEIKVSEHHDEPNELAPLDVLSQDKSFADNSEPEQSTDLQERQSVELSSQSKDQPHSQETAEQQQSSSSS
jgi:hypothetical protein